MLVESTEEFAVWIDGLKDKVGKSRILARIRRLADGNAGDHRNLKGGVSELRIDVGPGYRVYYNRRNDVLIILLCGGDKSSQKGDIAHALKLVKRYEQEKS